MGISVKPLGKLRSMMDSENAKTTKSIAKKKLELKERKEKKK